MERTESIKLGPGHVPPLLNSNKGSPSAVAAGTPKRERESALPSAPGAVQIPSTLHWSTASAFSSRTQSQTVELHKIAIYVTSTLMICIAWWLSHPRRKVALVSSWAETNRLKPLPHFTTCKLLYMLKKKAKKKKKINKSSGCENMFAACVDGRMGRAVAASMSTSQQGIRPFFREPSPQRAKKGSFFDRHDRPTEGRDDQKWYSRHSMIPSFSTQSVL